MSWLVALMLLGQSPPAEPAQVMFVLHNGGAAPISVALRHDFESSDTWSIAAGATVNLLTEIEGEDFLLAEVRNHRPEARVFPIRILLGSGDEGRVEVDFTDDRAVWRSRLRRGVCRQERLDEGVAEAVIDTPVRVPPLACLSFHTAVEGFGEVEMTAEPDLFSWPRSQKPTWRRLRVRGEPRYERGRWYLAPDGALHLSWFTGLHGPTITVARFSRDMASSVVMHSDDGPSARDLGPVEVKARVCPPRGPGITEGTQHAAGGG
jgi:hypothetical protein